MSKRVWRAATVGLALVAFAGLAGCNRNKHPLTACVDGRPVVERTVDVAPPNC